MGSIDDADRPSRGRRPIHSVLGDQEICPKRHKRFSARPLVAASYNAAEPHAKDALCA